MLNRRSARRTNDGRRIDIPLEILGCELADYRSVSVKLNLTGSLKARKVSAMANVARTRVVASVLVSG
jgi:hypothetical protein